MPIDIDTAAQPLEQAFGISAETHAEALAQALAACRTGGEVEALRQTIRGSMLYHTKHRMQGSGTIPRRFREGLRACRDRYHEVTRQQR